ncbi:MAG: glucose-methanol-choline oxidoreductase [Deltaproteobacteria bacterium]|nr:glucose-methanol-choline oxidoreductase [Deltaproteobacteria bacterium]
MPLPTTGHAFEDPTSVEWDAIVVGTGMGGATVGYELARRGRKVLFLEKGFFLHREVDAEQGDLGDPSEVPEERLLRGYWPLSIEGQTRVEGGWRGRSWSPIGGALSVGDVDFFAPLGCGSGGSTVLYGATLERFYPCDFRPKENFTEVTDSTLPDAWPVDYDELEPFYRRAEELFSVHGTPDPLHPDDDGGLPEPPPLNERDRDVQDLFQRKGLHPYRIHVGCEFVEGCDGCGGKLCLRECKSDSGRVCLVPAVEEFGARILTECEVTHLGADGSAVREVYCRWRGRELTLRGKNVILAAGALMTPVLLLNSKSDAWPDGLANRSGLVGRNLMVHTGDMIAVRPDKGGSTEGFNKSLSINDFYFSEGRKLGNFQSVGVQIDTGSVLAHLRTTIDKSPIWLRKLVHPILLRIAARIGAFYFRDAVVFGSIIEDLPYLHNRVFPDPTAKNGMRFEYEYPDELRQRNALFRRNLGRKLGRGRVVVLTRPINLNFGHLCGTCRFGDDPKSSVLDRSNRSHDVPNLYVVDGSFFPSSSGTNPSLTIAANALRVGGLIDERLGGSRTAGG